MKDRRLNRVQESIREWLDTNILFCFQNKIKKQHLTPAYEGLGVMLRTLILSFDSELL